MWRSHAHGWWECRLRLAKGRVLANMLVVNRGEDLLLVMAQDLAEAIVKRLRMFVLRAKVVFELMPDLAVSGEF